MPYPPHPIHHALSTGSYKAYVRHTHHALPMGSYQAYVRPTHGLIPGITVTDVDQEDNWIFQEVKLTNLEKRMIVAEVVKIGPLVIMNTHTYSQWLELKI